LQRWSFINYWPCGTESADQVAAKIPLQNQGDYVKHCQILIAATMLSTVAFAQKPAPKAPAPPTASAPEPQLSSTEKIALQSVQSEFQKVQQEQQQVVQELQAIERDILKNHPGYYLDEKTGTLAKDPNKK